MKHVKPATLWTGFILAGAAARAGVLFLSPSQQAASQVEKSFAPFPGVKTRHDDTNFYVESNGMPDHELMTGITAWQQQVPLPQNYTGKNAWQFPLKPVEAEVKLSAKDHFFRGAIAIAADGVPIFNPIKNDGKTDTFLAGELDNYGGHSGRSDDYHYHIAPVYLQKKLGPSIPVAYALDGYAIYGFTEPDGSSVKGLDPFNGHVGKDGKYHYHATKAYPYINGGFHGQVTEAEGQVDPQPRAETPRPSTPPLPGAKITHWEKAGDNAWSLTYTLQGYTCKVNYKTLPDGGAQFDYINYKGDVVTRTYAARKQRGSGQQQGNLGPPPGPRKPWFVDHAKELDANGDGAVSSEEVISQCKDAFKKYADGKDAIDIAELANMPPVRLAIGGFVKVHSKELDMNSDGTISEKEIIDSMMRMFRKQDKNGDGKLSGSELEA